MKRYSIDYISNTMTLSTAFEKAANSPTSAEAHLIREIRKDFPTMVIVRSLHRSCHHPNNRLTYNNMKKYMAVYENSKELLSRFEQVRQLSLKESNPYQFVLKWFKEQFPNFREIPDFSTNLYSNPLEPETPKIVPNGMSIVKEAVA